MEEIYKLTENHCEHLLSGCLFSIEKEGKDLVCFILCCYDQHLVHMAPHICQVNEYMLELYRGCSGTPKGRLHSFMCECSAGGWSEGVTSEIPEKVP